MQLIKRRAATAMDPEASYGSKRLSVAWSPLPGAANYTVYVDECDAEFLGCVNRLHRTQARTALVHHTDRCLPHINVKLEALNEHAREAGGNTERRRSRHTDYVGIEGILGGMDRTEFVCSN